MPQTADAPRSRPRYGRYSAPCACCGDPFSHVLYWIGPRGGTRQRRYLCRPCWTDPALELAKCAHGRDDRQLELTERSDSA